MKIATFNVNGVNGRLPVLLRWLEEAAPDVVCLQELKAAAEKFPEAAIRAAGYGAIWHGQKSWNGVAILARGAEPHETRRGLPGDPDDAHSRYIEAAVDGVLVGCLYLPNGNPAPGPKFEYKLRWFEHLTAHAADLLATGAPVVLAGDYNVMPTDLDVYKPERWRDDALFRPEVREAYRRLLAQGWTDALRALHPGERIYTFWDYFRNAYGRDAGLRIDHLLLSPAIARRLKTAEVDRQVRGWEKASDHAPTWIELADKAKRSISSASPTGALSGDLTAFGIGGVPGFEAAGIAWLQRLESTGIAGYPGFKPVEVDHARGGAQTGCPSSATAPAVDRRPAGNTHRSLKRRPALRADAIRVLHFRPPTRISRRHVEIPNAITLP